MLNSFLVRVLSVLLLLLPAVASAAPLDDYYLSKFGEQAQLAKALRAVVGLETEPAERCRTHLYRSLKRDFANLEPATQKTLGKYTARPVLSGQASVSSAPTFNSAHFAIHYTTTGADAPTLADANTNSVPDYVERVAAVFEEVYAYEVGTLGYRPPPVTRYDVYLRDLAPEGVYGLTTYDGVPASSVVSVGSYIEIDNGYTESLFLRNPDTGLIVYTSEQALQITAAHEFHHAIQFGYNYYFDIWYGEVTATWMEDELYDSVNQLYSYLTRYIPLGKTVSLNGPLGNNSEYGRWIFNRYLVERHSAEMVRAAWEKLGTLHPSTSPTTGGDIQMSPVLDSVLTASYGSALADEFFGFSKRIYARDWSSHTDDTGQIPPHALTASYSTYPVTSSSPATPSVTLPRYTFAFYRFAPSNGIATLNITVAKTTGIQTAVFRKSAGVVSEVDPGVGGNSYSVTGFNTLDPVSDEVVLLIANTTNVDGHQANFSTDGTSPTVLEPSTAPSGGGGGGGGCFIATAAYGSYLHPKVAELREFRDSWLMTNAPGRLFVSLYYRMSPPVAQVIGEHEWMRAGVRTLLVPLIMAVENPGSALALLLLSMGGGMWRLRRRRGLA